MPGNDTSLRSKFPNKIYLFLLMCFEIFSEIYFIITGFRPMYLWITSTLILGECKNIKVKRNIFKEFREDQAINQTFTCEVLPDKRQKFNFTSHFAPIFPVKHLTTSA